ncbi:hypothetical protein F0336_21300 [Serratia liquefaciens]|uniref:hypothetical protein n=1 Tax=Serratia liquefaciens TaxID=614 RepID=UPI0013C38890|nr:hypothetical protein [Serratia liquefaciens]QIC88833.1 hypothetical protein F0336_21300 [Serratia liquefaciens]
MLSQMNLRFHKSLIAALKNRAVAEAVPDTFTALEADLLAPAALAELAALYGDL